MNSLPDQMWKRKVKSPLPQTMQNEVMNWNYFHFLSSDLRGHMEGVISELDFSAAPTSITVSC